jgi:hypothetical protein
MPKIMSNERISDIMLDRIKNPLFLAAAIAFLYNVTNYVTQQFFGIVINPDDWLTFFNLLLYVVLGIGVYTNFSPGQTNPMQQPVQIQTIAVPQVNEVSPPVAIVPAAPKEPEIPASTI